MDIVPRLIKTFMNEVVKISTIGHKGFEVWVNDRTQTDWLLSQFLFTDTTALVVLLTEQLQCLVREFVRVSREVVEGELKKITL